MNKDNTLSEFSRRPLVEDAFCEEIHCDDYRPPDLFAPPTRDETHAYYHDLDETKFFVSSHDVSREQARKAYAELHAWNRESYNHMVELLEPPFLEHMERAANFIILHPYEVRKMAENVSAHQVPYKFAGLPPNLFDHLDANEPFLPQTKQEVLDLINSFQTYNERLRRLQKWDIICNGKEHPYRDIALELLRQQRTHPDLFATSTAQQEWRSYHQTFQNFGLDQKRPTFHQSVTAVNYVNNRQYSEMSGFFEKTDGMFDAFFLANFHHSRQAVTSQVRVPFMYGSEVPAEELLKSVHVLMQIFTNDGQLGQRAPWRLTPHEEFLETHLTRSGGLDLLSPIHNGLYGSLTEGAAVVGAVFAECEADGIPGFEDDYWGGINAMLDDDVAVKLAASVPPAIIMPPTLHGNRFERVLASGKNGLFVRPEVAIKIQQMLDRQTVAIHDKWSHHRQSLNRPGQHG